MHRRPRAEGVLIMRAEKTPSVPALVRGLAILERIAKSRRGLTFAQIGRQFEFPKSSVHTLLLTLEREGYLQRDTRTGRYVTGMKLASIASMTLDSIVLREKAARPMHALAGETDMTAHLAVLDRDEVILVAKVDRPGRQRVATWVGKRLDVHCTSLGKCLLAHLPDEEVDRIVRDRGLLRHNEHTIVSPSRLKLELARTRAMGYAIDDQEEEIGGRCIGAPIWNWEGQVVAAVSVTGTTSRITDDTIETTVESVRRAALEISRQLGFAGHGGAAGTHDAA
jgi:DNA-binding IclR family transcriptional regulator